MQNSKLKNSIVLRGMASNVVDEAIVILKPNIKIKNFQKVKNQKISKESNGKDFIVKEAENVINEYINRLNEKGSGWLKAIYEVNIINEDKNISCWYVIKGNKIIKQ